MSKINFPKKQEQRLIPKYLLEYAEELQENHPDPSEDWGGVDNIEAGTGIVITGDDTKTISVDEETVAMVSNLSTVAFSGSYSDLSNKPDLSVYELKTDAFSGDYADLTNKPDLSVYELKTDAFSGDYNDLTNKPTIPTATSQLTNDSGFITNSALADYETKFTLMDKPSGTSGTLDANTLAKIVASPESFMFRATNDSNTYLTLARNDGFYLYYQGLYHYSAGNKIFCRVFRVKMSNGAWTYDTKYTNNLVTGTNDGTNWTSITIGDITKSIPSGGSNYSAGTGIDITNNTISIDNTVALKSELFSGNYNDLTNKPTIPTKTSDLTNDSGYITGVTWNDVTGKPTFATVATSGSYDDLSNKPTIPVVPTNISAFTNDAGYITGITSGMVTTALGYTPGTSNFSGDYDDLTNKPTIPTVNTDAAFIIKNIDLNNYTGNKLTLNTDASYTTGSIMLTQVAYDSVAQKYYGYATISYRPYLSRSWSAGYQLFSFNTTYWHPQISTTIPGVISVNATSGSMSGVNFGISSSGTITIETARSATTGINVNFLTTIPVIFDTDLRSWN